MTHCMIDIETLGTTPGCIILSIGAVVFDPLRGTLGETLYRNLEQQTQRDHGLEVDSKTVAWWNTKAPAAKARLLNPPPVDAEKALCVLNEFLKENGCTYVWGHGAGFDMPIIRAAMDEFILTPAWKFWNDRDTRTIFDLANRKPDREEGVHHDALWDAIQQARCVNECYAALGLTTHSLLARLMMWVRHRWTGKYYAPASPEFSLLYWG